MSKTEDTIRLRDDGKGFVVRKGWVDWELSPVRLNGKDIFVASAGGEYGYPRPWSYGDTIMEAVDNVLAKVRKAEGWV